MHLMVLGSSMLIIHYDFDEGIFPCYKVKGT